MQDQQTNEIVLKANREAVAFRLSLGIAVIAAGSYFSIYLVHPSSAPFLTPLVVVIVTYAVFAQLVRLLLTGNAIILTDQGLLARVGDVDFVAWGEIGGAHLESYGGLKTVALDLRDLEAVLGRMSPLRRAILRFHMKRGGKPMLYGSFIQGGAEHLLQLIQQRIDLRQPEHGGSTRPVGRKNKMSYSSTKQWRFAAVWLLLGGLLAFKVAGRKGLVPETVTILFVSIMLLAGSYVLWRAGQAYAKMLTQPQHSWRIEFWWRIPSLVITVGRLGLILRMWLARVVAILALLGSGMVFLMAIVGQQELKEFLTRGHWF